MDYGPFLSKSQARAQGLRYYFDGSTCRKGHTDIREIDGTGTRCVICRRNKANAKYNRKKENPEWRKNNNAKSAKNKRRRRAARTPEQREAELAARREAKTPEQREHDRLMAKARYHATPREVTKAREDAWIRANRDKRNARINAYQKAKRESDPGFRLAANYRSFIASHIARRRGHKSAKLEALVGCKPSELAAHLEAQFADGMSWENYGEWHIDHIRPCASFVNLGTCPEEQQQCFHYTNLQPLWALENIKKGDTWSPEVNSQVA